MRKLILTLVTAVLASLALDAQQMSVASMDPVADSTAFKALRDRMDEIRLTRPTVGLVLSGGGAKGAAIIGVLKELERLDIPVDMITGTSIGGLVGAIYALGYKADDVDSVFVNADWGMLLSDRVPIKAVSYNRRQLNQTYNLVIPFATRKELDLGSGPGPGPDGDGPRPGALASNIPSGYVEGLNVNNLFSSLTVGYQDSLDFKDLPIPFVCVASDLVSCKAKNWTSGSLLTAMRSTMSIPLLFKPVRTDGMVLVDGGMRNNYPVDIARAAGVDYIIGVDLSDANLTYSQINNIGDVFMQGVDMLGRDSFEKNVGKPDITIKPDMTGFDMLSFNSDAIDTIMVRGQVAAAAKIGELESLKAKIPQAGRTLSHKPAVNIANTPVLISGVEFDGVSDSDSEMLKKYVQFEAGSRVSKKDIEDAVSAIYATGAFSAVSYRLYGTSEPFKLVINCGQEQSHFIAFGARMDTEELVSAQVNVGLNSSRLSGSRLSIIGKISSNPKLSAHYSFDAPHIPTFNADAGIRYTNLNLYHIGEADLDAKFYHFNAMAYISNIKLKIGDFKIGVRDDNYNVSRLLSNSVSNYNYGAYVGNHNYVSAFVDGMIDTMDSKYFPHKGMSMGIHYDFIFGGLGDGNRPVHTASFNFTKVIRAGSHFTITPSYWTRAVIGDNVPFPYLNLIGGRIAGKYMDQQIPFLGINYVSIASDYVGTLDLAFRYQIAKNHYATLHGAYLTAGDDFVEQFKPSVPNHCGVALEYGYSSMFGPVRFNIHWSDLTHTFGAFLSLGYDF